MVLVKQDLLQNSQGIECQCAEVSFRKRPAHDPQIRRAVREEIPQGRTWGDSGCTGWSEWMGAVSAGTFDNELARGQRAGSFAVGVPESPPRTVPLREWWSVSPWNGYFVGLPPGPGAVGRIGGSSQATSSASIALARHSATM